MLTLLKANPLLTGAGALILVLLTALTLQARRADRLHDAIHAEPDGYAARVAVLTVERDTLAAAVEIQNAAVIDLQARGAEAIDRAGAEVDAAMPVIVRARDAADRAAAFEPAAAPAGTPADAAELAAWREAAAFVIGEAVALVEAEEETAP